MTDYDPVLRNDRLEDKEILYLTIFRTTEFISLIISIAIKDLKINKVINTLMQMCLLLTKLFDYFMKSRIEITV